MRNPFTKAKPTGEIEKAYTVGEHVFLDDGRLPMALRSTLEREYNALQRGSSGVSDSGLAAAVKLSVPAWAAIRYYATSARQIPVTIMRGEDVEEYPPFGHFLGIYGSLIEDGVKSYLQFGKIFYRKLWNEHETIGNPKGYATGLRFVNPNNIKQITDKQTGIITGYKLLKTRKKEELPPSDIIYISEFDPSGDGNPLAALENAFVHLGVEQGIANWAVSFFFNNAVPAGMIVFDPPISKDALKKFEAKWKREFKGASKSHKTAFMNGKVTWTSTTAPPGDLALSELTDNSKQMIAAAFNVPPELVGLSDSSSSSLSQEQITATRKAFLEAVVIPTVGKILEALTRQWLWVDFSPPNFYSIVTNEQSMPIFSQATSEMITATNALIEIGTIDYEQQRTMLNLPKRPDNEDRLFLAAPPDDASALYNDGMISLNTANKIIGVDLVTIDRWKIDGRTIPAHELPEFISTQNMEADDTDIIDVDDVTPAQLPANVAEEIIPQLPALSVQPSRSITSVMLGVDFAGHNFVKTAQRKLSKLLSEAGVGDVTWIGDSDWRFNLMNFDGCTHAHVARMMRELDLSDNMRIELWSCGYRLHDGAIYWAIDVSEGLGRLQSSLRVEIVDGFGIAGHDAESIGIKLCHCNTDEINDEMLISDTVDAPLVIDNLSIYVDGIIRHSWRMQMVTEKQRGELRQWRKKLQTTAQRGKAATAVSFEPRQLPQHVVDYLNTEITEECDVTAVFIEARKRLDMRAIQATTIDFELFMEDTIAAARSGNLTRPRFTSILRNAINRFGNLAYRDGLVDGGVLDGTLDKSDRETADRLIKENKAFAKNLSARIFSEKGITDEHAASRPDVWMRKVVMPLYNAGRLSADKNGMYELVQLSSTADKCIDCIRLLGQVHRLSAWAARNLLIPNPGRQQTKCEGWECGHGLIPTKARANGRF